MVKWEWENALGSHTKLFLLLRKKILMSSPPVSRKGWNHLLRPPQNVMWPLQWNWGNVHDSPTKAPLPGHYVTQMQEFQPPTSKCLQMLRKKCQLGVVPENYHLSTKMAK